jgi:hypothetical protein
MRNSNEFFYYFFCGDGFFLAAGNGGLNPKRFRNASSPGLFPIPTDNPVGLGRCFVEAQIGMCRSAAVSLKRLPQ